MPMGSWTFRLIALTGCIASLPLLPVWGAAGPAHLVADLDPGIATFDPAVPPRFSSYAAVNGRVVFLSRLPEGTSEQQHVQCALWETDGAGVERLADFCNGTVAPKPASFQLRMLATTGSVAFFADPGGALWRTDATAAGTFPLGGGTLGVPPHNGLPPTDSALGPDGRTLFYDACTEQEGCELWASDGTRAGTRQIPLAPGPDDSSPAAFKAAAGRVFFVAGDQLWSSDGTVAGTVRLVAAAGPIQGDFLAAGNALYFIFNAGGMDTVAVLDLRSGSATNLGTFPASSLDPPSGVGLHTAGGRVLFNVYSPGKVALWEIAGTPPGARPIGSPDLFTSRADAFFTVGRRVVFAAGQGATSLYRAQLWALDPGSRRPRLLRPLPYAAFDLAEAALFTGRLFFAGEDAQGYAPWVTDGTPAGTRLLKRFAPGALDGIPAQFRVFGGSLVITTQQGDLWRTDGSPAGTVRLAGGAAGVSGLPLDAAALGLRIVFSGADPAAGLQPFVSDLTPAGTRPIAELGSSLAASSRPAGLAALGGKVLFASCKGGTGALRVSDGTRAGTLPLPGTTVLCRPYPPPARFDRAGDRAFVLWQGELWGTDGTREGTRVLAVGTVYDGAPLGDRFLFLRGPFQFPPTDFFSVFGLSDGTQQGSGDSFSVRFGSRSDPLVSSGNEAFFVAALPDFPFQPALWRTDGTALGTFPLMTGVESLGGLPPEVVRLGDRTYFILAGRSEVGREIWSTDGTAGGTAPLLPFPFLGLPFDLVAFHGRLYFFAVSGPASAPIYSLFFSDGTPDGTHFLHNFSLPAGGSGPFGVISPQLTVAGDQLFFRADDGVHGLEIWKTDGTPQGTVLVKDVNPGPDGSLLSSLTAAAGGVLYFAAGDGEHGGELWRSDGTEAGTTLVQDLFPGPAPSNPEQLTAAEGTLYFTADDGVHGRELWALPLPH